MTTLQQMIDYDAMRLREYGYTPAPIHNFGTVDVRVCAYRDVFDVEVYIDSIYSHTVSDVSEVSMRTLAAIAGGAY